MTSPTKQPHKTQPRRTSDSWSVPLLTTAGAVTLGIVGGNEVPELLPHSHKTLLPCRARSRRYSLFYLSLGYHLSATGPEEW